MSSPSVGVFITLSYENQYIPYILKSNVLDFMQDPLNDKLFVYRNGWPIDVYKFDDFADSKGHWYYSHLNTDFCFLREKKRNGRYKFLDDHVSVVYLRDIQLFFKRLKVNLFRDNYDGFFSYYYCSEYGERYNRCHFHVLAFIDKEYYDKFKLLVAKSWPYADLLRFRKQSDGNVRQSIELAKNPAKYVASYLNCSSYVPTFLSESKPFKPFTHFSNGFGCKMQEFTLSSLLEKINRGTLRYSYTKVENGISSVHYARVPKYVLYKYFPKFKGYRYLSSDALIKFISDPYTIYRNEQIIDRYSKNEVEDLISFIIRLKKRISCYAVCFEDWLFAYPRVWSIYASESIRDSYDTVRSSHDLFFHFDNICYYYSGDVRNDFLDSFPIPLDAVTDPNDFPIRRASTECLQKQFHDSVKHHLIKNYYYEESFS